MPLHELSITPADVSGAGLGLALNAPAPDPLATLHIEHPDGGRLTLGVLGASHVITVRNPEDVFSEQISCTARAHGGVLPDRLAAPGYQLDASHQAYEEVEFRSLADELRNHCATEPEWLGGAFPGDSAALTVIAATPDGSGWHWRTWHLYPEPIGGGTVVYTESRWRP